MDRGELVRAIRKREIRKELIVSVEKIINKSKSRVKMGGKVEEEFWTARGVR